MRNGKIKILFAVGRLSVGGAEKLLVHQLPAINRSVFNPHLITLFPETKESLRDTIKLPAGHWQKENFHSLFDFFAWIRLIRYLRKEKFDAVVTSLFSANLIVRIASIIAGVPIIIAYEHNLYPHKHAWQIWIDRQLSTWTHTIITDAETVQIFTSKQESIPIEKFVTMYIPPLLDAKAPKDPAMLRKELGIPEFSKIILTVSRLVPEKGHSYLIDAAAQVLREMPSAYFILVGWGPLESNLKERVKKLGLERNILLPGRMDIQDMLPLADIYAEPATNVDIGIALMEAMRGEKAIVATEVGEMPVFIHNDINGFLVKPADSSALAEKILLFLKDENTRVRFGKAAGETIRNYSLSEYMKNFESLIKKALNRTDAN